MNQLNARWTLQTCSSKNQHCNELAVKAPATKHDDLSSVPMFHVVEGQNQLGKVVLWHGIQQGLPHCFCGKWASFWWVIPSPCPTVQTWDQYCTHLSIKHKHSHIWLAPPTFTRRSHLCRIPSLPGVHCPASASQVLGYKPVPLQPNVRFSLCSVETGLRQPRLVHAPL